MTQLSTEQRDLVERHLGLAQHVALCFWKRAPNVIDRDEAIAVAYHGLVHAVVRFDLSYRPDPPDPKYDPLLAFGPFARTRITGAIQDWLRTEDYVPRRHRRTYRDLQSLGPIRSSEEKAAILGIDPQRVRAITFAVENPPVPLNGAAFDGVGNWGESHSQETDSSVFDGEILTRQVQSAVAEIYWSLPPLAKSVLALRYYQGLDFIRIAEILETSTRIVKQVHQEAVIEVHEVMLRTVTP